MAQRKPLPSKKGGPMRDRRLRREKEKKDLEVKEGVKEYDSEGSAKAGSFMWRKMSKKVILVLEDHPSRIKWLQYACPAFEVIWTSGVDDFLSDYEHYIQPGKRELAAVIMDHDLGISVFESAIHDGEDDWGLNGMDAARRLDVSIKVPIIVWSINGHRAPGMVELLKNRGFEAEWIPFSDVSKVQARVNGLIKVDEAPLDPSKLLE